MSGAKAEGERFSRAVREILVRRSKSLAREWLEELRTRLAEQPSRIFSEETLLDRVPRFLRDFARSLEGDGLPRDDPRIREELSELADLRRSQGYLVEELVEEFDLLGDLIFRLLERESDRLPPTRPSEILRFAHRLQRALADLNAFATEIYRSADSGEWMARTELLSGYSRAISHELRNRVNAAMLTVRAGRKRLERGSRDLDEQLDRLEEALSRIEAVGDDVNALTASQARRGAELASRMPLRDAVEQIFEDLRDLASERGVELRGADELPSFRVHTSLFQILLSNLVGNAIKYADRTESERWVRVGARKTRTPGRWRIEVSDNGRGIDSEEQQRIFRPRARGNDTQEEGEGFGLWLARQAARRLGGRLSLKSDPGRGSVFSFSVREPGRGPESGSGDRATGAAGG